MRTLSLGRTGLLLILLLPAFYWGCRPSAKSSPDKESGENPVAVSTSEPETETAEIPHFAEGKALYTSYCLVCHQATGGGVGGLNPPLKNTEFVLGEKERLIRIILHGSNTGLLVNGKTYSNSMPAFPQLSDEEVAYVATYVRNSFGNKAEAISPAEVEEIRNLK